MKYITLADAKSYLRIIAANTTDDEQISNFIDWATSFVEFFKGRHYDPRFETRMFDVPGSGGSMFGVFDSSLSPATRTPPLRFDEDLLELTTLTNGDGVAITDYVLEPANISPKMRVRLKGGDSWSADDAGEHLQVIAAAGFWGSHDQYTKAWLKSGQDLPASINASVTSFTVDSITPFKAGQLLRIDDELILVVSAEIVVTTPTLTVERAYNGSTAAVHAQDALIKIWTLQGNILQACYRLVKWRYSQKDVDTFDRTYSADSGITTIPTALPVDVRAALGAHRAKL